MFKQYRAKKKRAVNPDAPPRPTLLGHDKTMREMQSKLADHEQNLQEIDRLKRKVTRLEQTVNQLISALKRR
jgi:polyhydroxyalkanoate synthesis regulator phasin